MCACVLAIFFGKRDAFCVHMFTLTLLAAAPEICFRVGSAQLFAAEDGENFFLNSNYSIFGT